MDPAAEPRPAPRRRAPIDMGIPSPFEFAPGAEKVARTWHLDAAHVYGQGDNTVDVRHLYQLEQPIAVFVSSHVIETRQLLEQFPSGFKGSASYDPSVKIYITQDLGSDPVVNSFRKSDRKRYGLHKLQSDGISPSRRISFESADYSGIYKHLKAEYLETRGIEFVLPQAFLSDEYTSRTKASWTLHSKIVLILVQQGLRVIIPTANFTNADHTHRDNIWYSYDVPFVAGAASSPSHVVSDAGFTDFGAPLLECVKSLGGSEFVSRLDKDGYHLDWSRVKAKFVTSSPTLPPSSTNGIGRLSSLVNSLSSPTTPNRTDHKVLICTSPMGSVESEDLMQALGRALTGGAVDANTTQFEFIFMSASDYKFFQLGEDRDEWKGWISLGTPWSTVCTAMRARFNHYRSKRVGRVSHAKIYLVLDQKDDLIRLLVGSPNFSRRAWNPQPQNWECAVLIEGEDLKMMIVGDWRSLVPFKTELVRYRSDECARE